MTLKPLSNCFAKLTVFAVLSTASFSSFPLYSASQTAAHFFNFTEVAEEATPAVASIKVKSKATAQRMTINPWGIPSDDESDFFGNDFFRQFFSLPRGHEESTPIEGQASGFVVSPDGHLLTNSHVVKDATDISVTLNDGREFPAKVIGQDHNTDIALIKIDADDLPYLTLGNSDDLKPGQWAIAVGNPFGLQATVTVGVISATGRDNPDITRIEDFIQTDAPINRGNSGGPLLNVDGQVVGMNTAIVTSGGGGGYMGIGFAIPSNMLKRIMDELQANGKVTRGFLGITMQQLDANLAKAFNLDRPEGALVAEVSQDSPAEKAGIKQGDVILKYNGLTFNNIAALRNAVALMNPGSTITLSVLRDGKVQSIPITVGSYPTEEQLAAEEGKENRYGLAVQTLTPEMAKSLGYHDDKGVVILKVTPGTPAAWAGLKKGALILAVNQQRVVNAEEFNRAVEATKSGAPLLLLIKQDGTVRFVSLLVK